MSPSRAPVCSGIETLREKHTLMMGVNSTKREMLMSLAFMRKMRYKPSHICNKSLKEEMGVIRREVQREEVPWQT